ncbi:hypothetical protein F5B19DRAFT_473283 [Rostrohypoxylon terebratum]|nr:hypothetical protein F5B19DRAFT_473283 [Rostrohypoxylon terebratum]
MSSLFSSESHTPLSDAEDIISRRLAEYQHHRMKGYSDITVLLLIWEEDDIGVIGEVNELANLFIGKFGYNVHVYRIPSEKSLHSLSRFIMDSVERCGEDQLLIVYYGGHGERNDPDPRIKGPFNLAAKKQGGPELSWDAIQPYLFDATCDIIMILDCCYAGQALRARHIHRIECLCAVDKEQMTAKGNTTTYPSFTRVLIYELENMLQEGQDPTLSELQNRMVRVESGLMKQPLYSVMSEGPPGSPSIRLPKYVSTTSSGKLQEATKRGTARRDLYLQLSLLDVLDPQMTRSLVQWLTRSAPPFLTDIQLVHRVLSNAQETRQIGTTFLSEDITLSHFSHGDREHATRLLQDFTDLLSTPVLRILSTEEVNAFLQHVKQKSDEIITFLTDSLPHLNPKFLAHLEASEGMDELRSRIKIRLRLLTNDDSMSDISTTLRVKFEDDMQSDQKFRLGRRGETDVLVEYIYYQRKGHRNTREWASKQARRMAALHAEPKSRDFLGLPCLGLLDDTLHGGRFGIVYELPKEAAGRRFCLLSNLIPLIKFVPLDIRIRLGASLCNALLRLHSIGWYHKNIRSSNVLIFAKETSTEESPLWEDWNFGHPYLLGFDCSRPSDAETRGTVDFLIENNIYRHPERWGHSAQFRRDHDLYALGAILIELGSWRLLPSLDPDRKKFEKHEDPEFIRSSFLHIAEGRVAHAAGTSFAAAVKTCIAKQNWSAMADWEAQEKVRQEILARLHETRSLP